MNAETLQADISEDATLHLGDCLQVLRGMADASVDAIVTDPPYGLSFMGKRWDYDVPSMEVWAECLRVLKPGGHLLAFAGTRTQHRMAVRIEDAGFEIRDMIAWVYGSGFPKSLDVSKSIDKAAGAEREVVGTYTVSNDIRGGNLKKGSASPLERDITAPATQAARQWQGWGTALKPALEPITVARKPLVGTVAENVLTHGAGALNIDGCRVGDTVETWPKSRSYAPGQMQPGHAGGTQKTGSSPPGRWPSNLIHDGNAEVIALFPQSDGSGPARTLKRGQRADEDGWGMADAEGQLRDAGTGSAARFFYTAKAAKSDRDDGLEHMQEQQASVGDKGPGGDFNERLGKTPGRRRNTHPTVKPTDLMRYLCRLVTPPNGIVLDPFMGSGSTGRAALLEGFRFIGIEREAEYLEIARARVQSATPALWR